MSNQLTLTTREVEALIKQEMDRRQREYDERESRRRYQADEQRRGVGFTNSGRAPELLEYEHLRDLYVAGKLNQDESKRFVERYGDPLASNTYSQE